MEESGTSRITVSRDALRADLAEMELRLRVYFDEQLKHKADAGHVAEMALKLDSLDRGDFSPVHERALQEFVEGVIDKQLDRSWSRRERGMAVMSAFIAVVTFLISTGLALHGGL